MPLLNITFIDFLYNDYYAPITLIYCKSRAYGNIIISCIQTEASAMAPVNTLIAARAIFS